MSFLSKLKEGRIWERILRERISEPVHLNIMSLFVAAFGSVRAKIYFDLYVRQHHAFGLLNAADMAKSLGIDTVTAVEFGVANGAGLVNMCKLSGLITKETGIKFALYGFDTGTGMPPPRDYRDHPEHYQTGDFPMQDRERLALLLPGNAKLAIGDVARTAPSFIENLPDTAPLGFVSIDVDYYWSSVEALGIFSGPATAYLPTVTIYLDDMLKEEHNPWCGELAAVNDFNSTHELRKIAPYNTLRAKRLFKNAHWIEQIFSLHVLDHPYRSIVHHAGQAGETRVLVNPYF